jgi:dUTP pyrophosphatase
LKIYFKKLHPDAIIPTKAYDTDSGFDLYCLETTQFFNLENKIIRTGIAVQTSLPADITIRPRGSTSMRSILVYLGTVDYQYRGDCSVIVQNLTGNNLIIEKGQKIAQMVISGIHHPLIEVVDELTVTDRGLNGFGSSGK